MSTDYRFGNAELRPQQRQLLVGGKESRIGARAFDLLLALVERRDRVVPKDELLDSVWSGLVVEENNLQVHISSLRKVLGPNSISTIPGRGYRFTADLDDTSVGLASRAAPGAPRPRVACANPMTNLATELAPLYGRESDLHALQSLVESHRLVTVAGPGGIGKTVLAQALGHQLLPSFSDGVWLVEFAPLASPPLVATTAAAVLQVTLGGEAQFEALARSVARSRMLVILDNCEHLGEAVAALAAAFLRHAPDVRVLATSQEPLKLLQEHVYRLGPLGVPAGVAEGGSSSGAVALFEARARAADQRFALAPLNVEVVADICRRLDGIPLAIELAAARVPLLGVDGLRARLDDRFRILASHTRLALPRHQTLRAALDWSYGLLTNEEQAVFRQLAVFAGGFGLDSAQRVAGGGGIEPWAVLDHLGALVDKSLVVADRQVEPRYRFLETTRAFALEKLQEVGGYEAARRSHAIAVLGLFDDSLQEEFRQTKQALLDRYFPELDNARAALDWASGSSGDAHLHVALAGAVAWIWQLAGLRAEGMRRTRKALDCVDATTPPRLHARLLAAWAPVAWPKLGPEELASDTGALELYRALEDRAGIYRTLCHLSLRLASEGDAAACERMQKEAEQIFDPAWPRLMRVPLLRSRACACLESNRCDEGLALHAQIRRIADELGDKRLALATLINEEQAIAILGRWEESAARGHEMLGLLSEDRSLRGANELYVLNNLCVALTELGRVDEALEIARRVHPLFEQSGNILFSLDPFARLAFRRGRVEDSARMLGRAQLRYGTGNLHCQSVEYQQRLTLTKDLKALLPEAELSRLIAEGEALSDDDAARLALRD